MTKTPKCTLYTQKPSYQTIWGLPRLNFDNSAYRYIMKEDEEEQEILPITSDFFFEVFPFNIVFRQVGRHV